MTDAELLERFVATFSMLDDLFVQGPVPPELDGGLDDSPWARQKWRPSASRIDPSALNQAYGQLPGRFPPLYEQLVLSYCWLEVELDDIVRLIDGPALVEVWDRMYLPPRVRSAWRPLINNSRAAA